MQGSGTAPSRNTSSDAKPGKVGTPTGGNLGAAPNTGNGPTSGSQIKGFSGGPAGATLGTASFSPTGPDAGGSVRGFSGNGVLPGKI
jgi:hypothetical protein